MKNVFTMKNAISGLLIAFALQITVSQNAKAADFNLPETQKAAQPSVTETLTKSRDAACSWLKTQALTAQGQTDVQAVCEAQTSVDTETLVQSIRGLEMGLDDMIAITATTDKAHKIANAYSQLNDILAAAISGSYVKELAQVFSSKSN